MGEDGKGQKPAWMPDTLGEYIFWGLVAIGILALLDVLVFTNVDIYGTFWQWIDHGIDAIGKLVDKIGDKL